MARKTSLKLPGSVHAQWVRCGKANCKCRSGKRHGPYYARFWLENGLRRKQYIRLEDVERVKAACARYRDERRRQREEFRQAVQALKRLGQELREMDL